MAEGIRKLHSKGCPGKQGGRCKCKAGWEASVYSKREGKRIYKTFPRESEAKGWRAEARRAADQGVLRVPKPTTIEQAWDAWYAGAKAGTIRNRSGDAFKPSALRAYRSAMVNRVLPKLGSARLADLRRPDLQEFADGLLTEGLSPSSVQTTLLPLRAIFRRAISRGELAVSPCAGLHLPAVRNRRERFVSPVQADALIAAAPERDRTIWATAMYAGLRLGELRALRVRDIDLASGVIHVERGWDPVEGEIPLKSNAGRRRVPIAAALRDFLAEDLARTGRTGSDLIFGRTTSDPFTANRVQGRADDAWEAANKREREAAEREGREPVLVERVTPHELRHSYAATMIAAGVNAKALQSFMGHAKITVTLDTYGHLMPGSEAEATALVDAYVEAQRKGAEDAARSAGGSTLVPQSDTDSTGFSGVQRVENPL